MPKRPEFPLNVFYDGACIVCSTEMSHYMRKEHGGRLRFIDISAADFRPKEFGITLAEFMYQMHAIDRAGRVYRGVEAFWAVWQAFPASSVYGLMGTIITLPGINLFARLAYRGFARFRKYLPKRADTCENDVCRIGKAPQSPPEER